MAESHQPEGLEKIMKLNGANYPEWKDDMKAILILKDLWGLMHDDRPPAEQAGLLKAWKHAQNQTKSIILPACEPHQRYLIENAVTGFEVWEILKNTYASSNMQNVMELEELFGQAKKSPDQTMDQWVGHVRALENQLRGVTSSRLCDRILAGLGEEYNAMKAGLRARGGHLTVELVTEQLLAAESKMLEGTKNVNIQSNSNSTTILLPGEKTPAYIPPPRPGKLYGPSNKRYGQQTVGQGVTLPTVLEVSRWDYGQLLGWLTANAKRLPQLQEEDFDTLRKARISGELFLQQDVTSFQYCGFCPSTATWLNMLAKRINGVEQGTKRKFDEIEDRDSQLSMLFSNRSSQYQGNLICPSVKFLKF